MLYKRNNTKELDMELFKNPTSEYRGTPFWAWNCKLDKDMLLRQIDGFKEMGFGGFHMHSRSGMATKYLSDEFMELVKMCCKKAKAEDMLCWLYDEDRWPSGTAGGFATKPVENRQKVLLWSETPEEFVDRETGIREGKLYLLGVYDVVLDDEGRLKSYKRIAEQDSAVGVKRYAYVMTRAKWHWFNNETYIDTLSKEAMQYFINITHEAYNRAVGDEFGGVIPSIFTDEPQLDYKNVLKFAKSDEQITIPWTTDFADTYKECYGDDIIEKLPELFWDLPDAEVSATRYRYHDHTCERFTESFADQCGAWCREHGIALTGHMLEEPTLHSQTTRLGEAMRAYRGFDIPGMDMLCGAIELTTAKQTQSAVHQYDREAMLSEIYGVTGWDFDFRGHKFHGDWQAALGVTVRAPHLSWVSMKGSAKRDFPASINYQSPWYKDYSYVEDHFARLNTVLTRGKPIVNVGVIHPIESFWLHYGPSDTSSDIQKNLDNNFNNLTEWLIKGMVDFDFISESLLPDQYGGKSDKLKVGAMEYKTVLVPAIETIRRTTFNILKEFKEQGGRIIFIGKCPKYIDAVKTDEVAELYNNSEKVSFDHIEILKSLKAERTAEIIDETGETLRKFVHTLRQDGDVKWLFIAHVEQETRIDNIVQDDLTIIIDGEYKPLLYNTIDATVSEVDYEIKNGKTYIFRSVFPNDSLLLKLTDGAGSYREKNTEKTDMQIIDFKENVEYEREEDNVYILDMAEYRLDGGEINPLEELIIIDDKCRKVLNYPAANGQVAQPWVLGEDKIKHYVTLKFTVQTECKLSNVDIAAEEAESISVNGKKIDLTPKGYFVDESIRRFRLGKLKKGRNTIEIVAPIGKRTSIENFFLLGDFDVAVRGCEKTITRAAKRIGFSDLSKQGMPFYGGNLTYKTQIEVPDSELLIRANRYRGAAVKVYLDGVEQGIIAYSAYLLKIENVSEGKHKLEFQILGNRVNTFGALHTCEYSDWIGPNKWYTYKQRAKIEENFEQTYSSQWCYEYVLKETGIISSPVVIVNIKQ